MNRDSVPPATLKLGFAGCGEVAVEKHLPALAGVRGIEMPVVGPMRVD